jgi:hypothetical protein
MRALKLAALVSIVPAASAFAQVVDHSQARALIGQEATINGPVVRVERLPDGGLRLSLGRSFEERSLEIIVPAAMSLVFGDGLIFQGKNVDVHGRILAAADSAQPGVPAILLADSRDLRVAPRRIVVTGTPTLPQDPALAPQPRGGDSADTGPGRWAFTLAPGFPVGGPSGQMKDRLLADGWTEQYCDFNRSECHDNPLVRAPRFSLTGSVTRVVNRHIEARGFFSFVGLGRAEGRRQGIDVETDWSTFILGAVVSYTPFPMVRVGAGPVVALLNSQRFDNLPRTVGRPGMIFEGGIRSSSNKSTFLELSVSYRLLPSRSEGPWPGRLAATVIPAGPGTMQANFSHFSLSLGFGIRFSGNAE